MIKMKTNVTPGETPEKITVSMIDQDLKDGISKPEMAVKYNIKPWEVDEMFKHPFLKGRRPSRKKALSFTFEDDTDEALMKKSSQELLDQIDELPDEDPNQITLHDAIDDAIESATQASEAIAEAQEAIVDILGPTEETPEETILKAAHGNNIDELDAAEPMNEQPEDEIIEDEDDTFEL